MPRQPVCYPPDPEIVAGFERIRERLEIPAEFPQDVLQEATEAAAVGAQVPDSAAAKIRDVRDIPFIAIGPAGSTDLDQAFAAQRSSDGYIVSYAIADVAASITPGGPIDREARVRGVTLYSPVRRTSLHPEATSENAGSLLAGRAWQALLWTIELDAAGVLGDARIERARVRNRQELSYRQAQDLAVSADPDEPIGLLERSANVALRSKPNEER